MDWSNLLSGAVGALIGVAGVMAATVMTARDVAAQARQANVLRVSGRLGELLIIFYEDMRLLLDDEQHGGEETLDTGRLGPPAATLRRAITIDAPLLDGNLHDEMKLARSEIKRIIGRQPRRAARGDLVDLLQVVRAAGDLLRAARSDAYDHYARGAKLGTLRRHFRRRGPS